MYFFTSICLQLDVLFSTRHVLINTHTHARIDEHKRTHADTPPCLMCRTHNNLSCLNKLLLRVCFSLSECRSECDSCFDKNFCTRCRAGFYLHLGKCQENCPDGMVHNDTQRECVLSEFSWSEMRTERVHPLFPCLRFIAGAWKQVQLWLCLQAALQSVSCVWTARRVRGASKGFTN